MGRGDQDHQVTEAELSEGNINPADLVRGSSAIDQGLDNPIPGTPYTQRELLRFADRLLDAQHVKEGDIVAVEATHPEHLAMVQALNDMAFKRGAMVEAIISPTSKQVDRLVDSNAAFIRLNSTPVSASLEQRRQALREKAMQSTGIDFGADHSANLAQLVDEFSQSSLEAFKYYNDRKNEQGDVRWNFSVYPTREWAAAVYPELPPDEAFRKMGQDMLFLARATEEDGPDGWKEHVQRLHKRADTLNDLDIDTLEIVNEAGMSISMKMAEGSKLMPCDMLTSDGQQTCVNTPTEEVFGTPDPASVNGTIVSQKPLMHLNKRFDDLKVTLEGGRVTSVEWGYCSDPDYTPEQALQEMFDPAKGLDRMGEIGLVGIDSRVGQLDRTFYNTYIDENSGLHFGMGNSFSAFTGGEGNKASGHFDVTCGEETTEIYANTKDGRRVKVMENGLWLI